MIKNQAELAPHIVIRHQALRLRRFGLAVLTYAMGFAIMALCSAVGLLPPERLGWIGLAFVLCNGILFGLFYANFNLRFADPSLTQLQILLGVGMVFGILILGAHTHFLALPFYSSLFVFAMLQMSKREVLRLEFIVLCSYGLAVAIRNTLYAGQIDVRIELIYLVLVILSSVWFAFAAGYISALRSRVKASRLALEQLAIRDALTGVWNRRHIDSLLAAEVERKARFGGQLSVCMVDLDHFKSINDQFGHPVGDSVLKQVAEYMQAQLRTTDQIGRFGGEEFLILLPGIALKDTVDCAQRLLHSIAALELLPNQPRPVTISIGISECAADESPARLVERADRALYAAKENGRNCLVVH